MAALAGYVVLKNRFGKPVNTPCLTVTVAGATQTLIREVSLGGGETSPSAEYNFAGGNPATWDVSFTPEGASKPVTGSVVCNLATTDDWKTVTVTLRAADFTVAPTVSPSAQGVYAAPA